MTSEAVWTRAREGAYDNVSFGHKACVFEIRVVGGVCGVLNERW